MEGIYSCGGRDGGLRDPRPRLRWTPDLHDRFVDAVTRLGGPDSESLVSLFSFFLVVTVSRFIDYGNFVLELCEKFPHVSLVFLVILAQDVVLPI